MTTFEWFQEWLSYIGLTVYTLKSTLFPHANFPDVVVCKKIERLESWMLFIEPVTLEI